MVLTRYILLQVPGWLLLGILLWWAHSKDWIGVATGAWIMGAWLAKDALLYPLCKYAFEDTPQKETDRLIGREAEAANNLDPKGQVRLGGELWSARSGNGPIAAGTHLRITGVDGLILIVEPVA